jgi:hypothetical protein
MDALTATNLILAIRNRLSTATIRGADYNICDLGFTVSLVGTKLDNTIGHDIRNEAIIDGYQELVLILNQRTGGHYPVNLSNLLDLVMGYSDEIGAQLERQLSLNAKEGINSQTDLNAFKHFKEFRKFFTDVSPETEGKVTYQGQMGAHPLPGQASPRSVIDRFAQPPVPPALAPLSVTFSRTHTQTQTTALHNSCHTTTTDLRTFYMAHLIYWVLLGHEHCHKAFTSNPHAVT